MANMPPLTIRKPETLANRLDAMEQQVFETAEQTGEKSATTLRINGQTVSFTVTPSVRPGRFYSLFRVNGKRTAKGAVPANLLG